MNFLRIGVDFDNTIVSYDGIFHKVAVEKGLIPVETPPSKGAVRDYFRSIGKEPVWTELQGYVYGTRMDLAKPYPGVLEFFALCQKKKIPVFIISHKTLHPFLGPRYDLHAAAKQWLQEHGLSAVPAFFEVTLEKKLQRIAERNCTVFIDDLPEVFAEKTFPNDVSKVLFDPHELYSGEKGKTHSWEEIGNLLTVRTDVF